MLRLPVILVALGCLAAACTFGGGAVPPPVRQPVGGPCATGADCTSTVCMPSVDGGWPGGYCTATCGPAHPCAEGACEAFVDAGQALSVCLATCDGGCRQGYACRQREDGGAFVCVP